MPLVAVITSDAFDGSGSNTKRSSTTEDSGPQRELVSSRKISLVALSARFRSARCGRRRPRARARADRLRRCRSPFYDDPGVADRDLIADRRLRGMVRQRRHGDEQQYCAGTHDLSSRSGRASGFLPRTPAGNDTLARPAANRKIYPCLPLRPAVGMARHRASAGASSPRRRCAWPPCTRVRKRANMNKAQIMRLWSLRPLRCCAIRRAIAAGSNSPASANAGSANARCTGGRRDPRSQEASGTEKPIFLRRRIDSGRWDRSACFSTYLLPRACSRRRRQRGRPFDQHVIEKRDAHFERAPCWPDPPWSGCRRVGRS